LDQLEDIHFVVALIFGEKLLPLCALVVLGHV